jgi:hypothetical protein
MGRVTRLSREQRQLNIWWVRFLVALVFLGLGYWFASIAIDDGNLFHYAIAIILVVWAFIHLARGVKTAFVR